MIDSEALASADWGTANFIINSDASRVLSQIPTGLINTVVTSSPYFDQRDYEVEGQVGSEACHTGYIDRLVTVFRGAREALREDGTLG